MQIRFGTVPEDHAEALRLFPRSAISARTWISDDHASSLQAALDLSSVSVAHAFRMDASAGQNSDDTFTELDGRGVSESVIRVMVVEDHHLVRAGLVTLLRMVEDFEVVAEAGDGMEAVEQFRLQCPDVTLTDLRLPRLSGTEVIRSLRRESEEARIIVLTAHDGEEDVYRAIQAGARAYLLKGSTSDELIRTIRLVYQGELHFPLQIVERLAKRLSAEELTARETDVLGKIVQGMTNKRIALLLDVSEATVKAHVNSLFIKLGVSDRTQAAMAAIRQGIVTLDSHETGRLPADRPEQETSSDSSPSPESSEP